jgi:hypothetical protein
MRVSEYEVLSESDEEFTTSVYTPTFSDGYGDDVDIYDEPYEGEEDVIEWDVELVALTYDGHLTFATMRVEAYDMEEAKQRALEDVSIDDFDEDVDMSTLRVRGVF